MSELAKQVDPPAHPTSPSQAGLWMVGRSIKIVGSFLEVIAPHTEADPWALSMDLLTWFGNVIGPNPYFVADGAKHGTRLFVVIVGRTSKARKGTSRAHNANLSELVYPDWHQRCVAGGLASGEGLVRALVRDDDGQADLRLQLVETEFSRVLRAGGREGATISEILRQAWDGGRIQVLRSKDPLRLEDSHVSLIGHITFDELRSELSRREIHNGLANRLLFIGAERVRLLPDGGNIDERSFAALAKDLQARIDCARKLRRIYRTEAGQATWHDAYYQLAERDHPGAFGSVCARAEAQVLRLSLVLALIDGQDAIDTPHIQAAMAIWNHAERTAFTIWGEYTGNPVADRILEELRRVAPGGLTATAQRKLFGGHKTSEEMAEARKVLRSLGLARDEIEKTPGRDRLVSYAQEAQKAKEGSSSPDLLAPSALNAPPSRNGEGR